MSRVTVSIPNKLEGELKKFAKNQKESVSKITAEAIEITRFAIFVLIFHFISIIFLLLKLN